MHQNSSKMYSVLHAAQYTLCCCSVQKWRILSERHKHSCLWELFIPIFKITAISLVQSMIKNKRAHTAYKGYLV